MKHEDLYPTPEERTELRRYAELCNDEVGETCHALLGVQHAYTSSDDFRRALTREIRAQLQNFRDNAVLNERTETLTRTYKTLDWKSEL